MVEITAVHPHSRGEKAGIREGDILMSLNGHAVTDVLAFTLPTDISRLRSAAAAHRSRWRSPRASMTTSGWNFPRR